MAIGLKAPMGEKKTGEAEDRSGWKNSNCGSASILSRSQVGKEEN